LKSNVTFVVGGCRSGKTRFAQTLVENRGQSPRIYVATCQPQDEEMLRRVARHQQERANRWRTEEVPIRLDEAILRLRPEAGAILVDCLTLWVSNLMFDENPPEAVLEAADALVRSLDGGGCPVVVVSNEVGTGIVPENRLAREYRDAVGFVNQRLAACADNVVHMVAGIPVAIKGSVA
jgi:adenosylcobinamide kinase/adenosylcobinamide-phosphate guanylyltransferase